MELVDVPDLKSGSFGSEGSSPSDCNHINFHMEDSMEEAKKEQTRVRMNYTISTKGIFTPNITAEAETVETATLLLAQATAEMNKFAEANGFNRDY